MHLNDRARKGLPWLLLTIAVIATAAVYWAGRTGGWVFDDYPNIVDNAAIHITRGHSTLAAWVNSALSSPSSFLHRPLASLTFSVDWYFGGGNPWNFKVTNIIIHLVNGVLLFVMLRALLRLVGLRGSRFEPLSLRERGRGEGTDTRLASTLREPEPSLGAARHPLPEGEGFKSTTIDDSAATRLALIVAAAWMLLPINLMAVLYVVQRMESLCQVLVLAGLWAYLHGRWMMLTASGDTKRYRRGFAIAVAGIVLGTLIGLTSKETAVLLPVFCFLAEWVVIGFVRARTCIPPPLRVDPLPLEVGEVRDASHASPPPSAGRGIEGDGFSLPSPSARTTTSPRRYAATPFASEGGEVRDASSIQSPPSEGRGIKSHAPPPPSAGRGIERDGSSLQDIPPMFRIAPLRSDGGMRTDRRIWTLFTITLFVPGVLGFLWLLRGVLRPGALAGRDFTLAQRLMTEPRVLVDYLHWTLLPNPAVLSLYHDEIVKSTGLLAPWTTLGSIVLLLSLLAVAVWLRKRRPLVSLGILWFFAGNLLTATIIPLELVYEQRMYFPSIGVLLAVGALLLGLRWKIMWPLLRGFLVTVALVWFAVVTNLRAQEWSNPLRLAIAEANRHPESPRAVYEAGRLLLIDSNYSATSPTVNCPSSGKVSELECSMHYLQSAAAIPGSSALADQALIMIADHQRQGADADYWRSMIHKLRDQPTRQEDISALISLTNCYGAGICKFDVAWLQRAYATALSRPHPIARLNGAYADFQRDILHDDMQAEVYLARAVAGEPDEPAYRVDLAALYARNDQTEKALEQIDALRRLNYAGRLDRQIATLERLAEQRKTTH